MSAVEITIEHVGREAVFVRDFYTMMQPGAKFVIKRTPAELSAMYGLQQLMTEGVLKVEGWPSVPAAPVASPAPTHMVPEVSAAPLAGSGEEEVVSAPSKKGGVTRIKTGVGLLGGPITGVGTVSVDFGSGEGKVCEGNDPRLLVPGTRGAFVTALYNEAQVVVGGNAQTAVVQGEVTVPLAGKYLVHLTYHYGAVEADELETAAKVLVDGKVAHSFPAVAAAPGKSSSFYSGRTVLVLEAGFHDIEVLVQNIAELPVNVPAGAAVLEVTLLN